MVMNLEKRVGITQTQTLLIMGIVFLVLFALIAVPFYNSYKQKHALTKLKTLYSSITKADKIYSLSTVANYGEYNITLNADEFAQKYFTPYLNVEETCKTSQDACWNEVQYTDLSGKKYTDKIQYSLVLSDKTVVGFSKDKNGLISMIVDIDGKVGKNMLGRDVFVFYFYNDQLQPKLCESKPTEYIKNGIHFGGYDKCGKPHDTMAYKELFGKNLPDACNKKAPASENGLGVGAACLALIYKSNWTIDKIYPW